MHPHLRACLVTLALPLLATLLAEACIWKTDATVREQVRRQYPEIAAERFAGLTVATLDERGVFASRELPELYARLQLVRNGAVMTGAVGGVLLAGIFWAGRATRNRRDLLLRLFRPGLYVTLTLVALLTAAQGLELAFALYYFEAIYFERVHFIFALGVAIGGVLAFFAVLTAMFSMLRKAEFRVLGQRVTPAEQPGLWAVVLEVCRQLGTRPPDHVVLGLEPMFYVTESEVTLATEAFAGRTLHVSLSFCRLLTLPELKAIIGHEMAHFIGADTVFSQRFFPVYRATCTALTKLGGDSGHASVALARMPALSLLGFFLEAFATSEKNLSRQRELEADATGASIAGPRALAMALVKVHAYAPAWANILKGVRYQAEEFRAVDNLATSLLRKAAMFPREVLSMLGEHHVAHPIDSHPPLVARLAALQTDLATMAPLLALPEGAEAASSTLVDAGTIEQAQTLELRRMLTA